MCVDQDCIVSCNFKRKEVYLDWRLFKSKQHIPQILEGGYAEHTRKIDSVANYTLHTWVEVPGYWPRSRCITGYAQKVYTLFHRENGRDVTAAVMLGWTTLLALLSIREEIRGRLKARSKRWCTCSYAITRTFSKWDKISWPYLPCLLTDTA